MNTMNTMNKITSFGAICAMAFFGANTALADLTVSAGGTQSYNTTNKNITGTVYLNGSDTSTATLTVGAGYTLTISANLVMDYGTFGNSGNVALNVADVIMTNASEFKVNYIAVTAENFTASDTSMVNLNGVSAGTSTFKVTDTMTLNGSASLNFSSTYSSKVTANLVDFVMNDSSSVNMTTGGTLAITGNMEMNDSSTLERTAGTLRFADGSSLTINDSASFDSTATTLNGTGTIHLTLEALALAAADATDIIEGSLDLGTVTFGSTGWTIELDVSSVLDGYDSNFNIALSDLLTIDNADSLSSDYLNIVLVDADGNTYSDYELSLSGDYLSALSISGTYIGTAVPEPSTYAMIFGVVALGFAAYRRRK